MKTIKYRGSAITPCLAYPYRYMALQRRFKTIKEAKAYIDQQIKDFEAALSADHLEASSLRP